MHSPFSAPGPDPDPPPDVPFDEDTRVMIGNAADWTNVVAAMYDEVGDKTISAISRGMDFAAAVSRGACSYMIAA